MQCPKCNRDSVVQHGARATHWACISCWHSWPKAVDAPKVKPPTFQQVIMEKIAAKKRELSYLEKMEKRERWRDFTREKGDIKAAIRALHWCCKAYDQFAQTDINEMMAVK